MIKFFDVLRKCPLFDGIEDENLDKILHCLGASSDFYDKKFTIFTEGKPIKYIGIVLSGSVQAVQVDYYGNRSIVAQLGHTQLFGESFACAGVSSLPVSVTAVEECQIMLIDCKR
ncbi:MAG: cyclic nucleotide-binding domain-containing protein, partial [Clostridia bacterium]|nr:cyclic nucleotide-binding domain-containing protein [Clostridia bacterium]